MMEYPKKKDLSNRAEQTSTFTNDRSFNDAISQMSAEIRRRCDVTLLRKIIMSCRKLEGGHYSPIRQAEAICKHFEEGLDNGD